MNLEQIRQNLEGIFKKQPARGGKRHVLFWYDAEANFVEEVKELELSNAKIWHLTSTNNFLTKYTIEELEQETNFLVYSTEAKPEDHDNWLLDILLQGTEFSADRITMVMNELDISHSLRGVFAPYERFFRSKERLSRFISYNLSEYTEKAIDTAVLSALAKQRSSNLGNSLRAIFTESLEEESNSIWQAILSFGNEEAFWRLIEAEFGFDAEVKTLEKLFTGLVVTAFAEQFHGKLPDTWEKLLLRRQSNCVVFIDHFMNHGADKERFTELVLELEPILHLSNYLEKWELEDLREVDVFPSVDKAIIASVLGSLLNGAENFDHYEETIINRRTTAFYPRYEPIYDALYWATKLFRFQKEHASFVHLSADSMFEAYTLEYHEVDYAYRKFVLAYDQTTNLDSLYQLSEAVENLYCNWFLSELSISWSKLVEEELATNWLALKVKRQQSFYNSHIEPIVKRKERVFVIISDALRYEAGFELAELLNQNLRGKSTIEPMQGVVPSYTQLGMAVLLPHKRIKLAGSNILVDDLNTSGLERRQKILQVSEEASIALSLADLMKMDRKTLRDVVKGKYVVYLYHDTIDAIGDQAKTEDKTFDAVETALQEIMQAVDLLVKNLSEANIYITSDHGFIYQRRPLEESDKTPRSDVTPLSSNRRFMIFDEDVGVSGTISVNLNYLFGLEQKAYAVMPRANNRYKLQGGGQRFVHGGASLQEIVIPLIHFTNDRRKDPSKEVTKVDVVLTNDIRRITNGIFSLNFFQTEPVGGKKIPRQLKAYFIDPDKNIISDEIPLFADSTEENADERNIRLGFNLKTQSYDRSETYHLVLEDLEETVEKIYTQIPFSIDLGIMHDFDF